MQERVHHRDAEILRLRRQGLSLRVIGGQVGLTGERVRQRLLAVNGPSSAEVHQTRDEQRQQADNVLADMVRGDLVAHPSSTLDVVAARLDLARDVVRRVVPEDCKVLVARGVRASPRRWQDTEVLEALQHAATFGFPLATTMYDDLVRVGEVDGPVAISVMVRFGTWRAACELAGVESPPAPREDYQSRWSDQDLLAYVRDYLLAPGSPGTFAGYDVWKQAEDHGAPSSALVRTRLGRWNEVKKSALADPPHLNHPTLEEGMAAEENEALAGAASRVGQGGDAREGAEEVVPVPSMLLGPKAELLDQQLATSIDDVTRAGLWSSAGRILAQGPLAESGQAGGTCLALGYVQSGKTTSITALTAAAADAGYRVVVALLGSTNLLLEQNRTRLEGALTPPGRTDYTWLFEHSPSGSAAARRISTRLDGDRTILITVLKHAGRIRDAAGCLAQLVETASLPVLIVDDEADQASLNTGGQAGESATYEAVRTLREALPNHLYVQYTATPYAPLMLDADDLLSPRAVEFLTPGPGYTGGREFFVDHADHVVRDVPALEEQVAKTAPLQLPASLERALANFIVGAAMLLSHDPSSAPVSMLVHSTARNDVQERYHFLLERKLAAWKRAVAEAATAQSLPLLMLQERDRLTGAGAAPLTDGELLDQVVLVLREATPWLVNTASKVAKVDWAVAPVHILVGGNKLDRGFTVEGLTVTYMNRPASVQVDTLEQRARAFGYRRDQLAYCQFFASKRTVRSLRDIVFTEYDLRSQLHDHVAEGGTVHTWAQQVGLLLPEGMQPTRDAVVDALSHQSAGWQSLRRPASGEQDREHNRQRVVATGLLQAAPADYGRLRLRTVNLPLHQVITDLIEPWALESYSPTWRHDDILQALRRRPDQEERVFLTLMEDEGRARTRRWDDAVGFVNLFQGHDVARVSGRDHYPGDRAVPYVEDEPDRIAVQVHRITARPPAPGEASHGAPIGEILTLAIYLGTRGTVRKAAA